jgi:hypothetical protein
MGFLGRFNPFRALGDLRQYLAARQRHEIIFLFVALALAILIITGFAIGTRVERPYRPPDIIYVQSWRADRSDADIVAQQKIDAEQKKIQDAKEAKFEAEKRAAFKRANDALKRWGI